MNPHPAYFTTPPGSTRNQGMTNIIPPEKWGSVQLWLYVENLRRQIEEEKDK